MLRPTLAGSAQLAFVSQQEICNKSHAGPDIYHMSDFDACDQEDEQTLNTQGCREAMLCSYC